jgi:D-sedoheptulose 7-phosphate isomerase
MENFIKNFLDQLNSEIKKISCEDIAKTIKILQSVHENNGRIYLIGNGGSSAIASHFANDLNKMNHDGDRPAKRFQAVCLSDNVPVLTAWANDVGYEKIFSEQLKNFAKPNDVLIAISSSGNSPNIIEAAKTAKNLSLSIIGFVGFNGGKLSEFTDARIYIPSQKYGIVESAHDAICHLIIAYLQESI